MNARAELIVTLHGEGAYCGNCAFDGLASCADCRFVVGRYADRLIGDGWVKMPSREAVRLAVQEVLFNASNYPPRAQALILGTDTAPLTAKVTDAIVALLAGEVPE